VIKRSSYTTGGEVEVINRLLTSLSNPPCKSIFPLSPNEATGLPDNALIAYKKDPAV
jgi:hypothetical protein